MTRNAQLCDGDLSSRKASISGRRSETPVLKTISDKRFVPTDVVLLEWSPMTTQSDLDMWTQASQVGKKEEAVKN
jgi:hypothetical protein